MRSWELAVALDAASDTPVFLQIARAVAADIRRGRLAKGSALPGSRTLAGSLGVHRNTVLAAYRELAAEGWISGEAARGTFVSSELPDAEPRRPAPAAQGGPALSISRLSRLSRRVGYELGPSIDAPAQPALARGTLVLSGGVPDMRLAPATALSRAYRRALRIHKREVLDYGDPQGHARLRIAIASMLAAVRGVGASEATVLITRGSQMAVDLIARALITQGDVVAVEALGYRPAWSALRHAGARLVPLPVDASGLSTTALSELISRERVRAVYVTPHHQYPTTAMLAPGRRLELLALARANRIAIIEDDYDHEFHYEGRPILPLASADTAGVVIYVGTLSKILAPGLRLGFVAAPPPLIERLTAIRAFVDRQGDLALEVAVADLMEDGEVQRHARRMRRVYKARRDALVEALSTELGSALSFDVPAGGMAIWARADSGIDIDAWAARALDHRVLFHPARRFAFDGRARPFARLGFASLSERELAEAARRMASALR